MEWDFGVVWLNAPMFLRALIVTVRVTCGSILLGVAMGTALGVAALARGRMSWIALLARGMTALLLAVPPLVLIIWIYFCLPVLHGGLIFSGEQASVLGLGLSLSAFVGEIVRAGASAVPFGQIEAAYCVGLTKRQAVTYVLLPQALRKMWAPLLGQFITCYKFSTLASVVAVGELLHEGGVLIAQTYRPLEVYTAIAAIFIVTVLPLDAFSRRLEKTARFGGTERL